MDSILAHSHVMWLKHWYCCEGSLESDELSIKYRKNLSGMNPREHTFKFSKGGMNIAVWLNSTITIGVQRGR